jgi:hypothetical protein
MRCKIISLNGSSFSEDQKQINDCLTDIETLYEVKLIINLNEGEQSNQAVVIFYA